MSKWVLFGTVEMLIVASSSVQIANILEAKVVGAVNVMSSRIAKSWTELHIACILVKILCSTGP